MTWGDTIIFVLRILILVGGLTVAWLFRRDALSLVRGRFTAPAFSGSSLCWFAANTALYQIVYFTGVSQLWRASLIVGGLMALALAFGAYRSRRGMSAEQLDSISANLPISLTCADLERVDPEYSAELHALMRTRLAERLVNGNG